MYDAAFRKKEMDMRDYGDESTRLERMPREKPEMTHIFSLSAG